MEDIELFLAVRLLIYCTIQKPLIIYGAGEGNRTFHREFTKRLKINLLQKPLKAPLYTTHRTNSRLFVS